ncbi:MULTISPECIES: hypothetical protein [Microbacterium]|uniref:hypothetical protein n=1 Tax=Microbacterium TaxID=33882 RepID=UPI001D176A69|nr:hypothetical protein [Microbacterium testaceum]MCC4250174.1 hypothetical protein [Microbacterium testaceum]
MRQVTLAQLLPAPDESLPAVEWDGSPTSAELYAKYGDQVAGATIASLRYLAEAEPEVTGDVLASIPDGCRPDGLQFRMKSPGSLAAKINRKAERYPDLNPYDVSEKITDLLRYTSVAPTSDEVLPMARDTLRNLKSRGWELLEVEHSYVDGNPYKGLHAVLRHPGTQQEIEVQFHSEQGIQTKTRWHEAYEIARDDDHPWEERAAAHHGMVGAWSQIPIPRGLTGQQKLLGVDVVAKSYPNPYDKPKKGRRP